MMMRFDLSGLKHLSVAVCCIPLLLCGNDRHQVCRFGVGAPSSRSMEATLKRVSAKVGANR